MFARSDCRLASARSFSAAAWAMPRRCSASSASASRSAASFRCSPTARSRRRGARAPPCRSSLVRAHARQHHGQRDQDQDDDDDQRRSIRWTWVSSLGSFRTGRPIGFPRRRCNAHVSQPTSTCSRTPCTPTARWRPPRSSRAAAAAGVELMALTDHDTVDGVAEALARRARPRPALLPGGRALGVDRRVRGPARPRLRARPRRRRARRRARGLPRRPRPPHLRDGRRGWRSSASCSTAAASRATRGSPLGRPHLADAVLAHPANAERLRAEGHHGQERALPALPRPGAPRLRRPARARPSPTRSR